ncbi:MAG TPA: hypothetical protein VFS02_02305 [Telluria sp.]|nr:hypothetical protein [Telluria sp.]
MDPSRPAATPLKAGAGTAVAGGGEPPYDGNMEHRITALEARWDAIIPTLATKADVAALGAELRAELREGLHQNAMAGSALGTEMQHSAGELRAEMQQSSGELRAEMQKLRTEMHQFFGEMRTDMQKLSADNKSWMLATVLTIVGTTLAAIIGISQVQKATPPAPIIITVPATR